MYETYRLSAIDAFGTGSVMANETIAGLFRADLLCDPREEILLVDIRLERAPGRWTPMQIVSLNRPWLNRF